MNGEVEGVDLLDTAHSELQDHIIPKLSGDSKYRALLIAKALRMVARELAQADARRATATAAEQIIQHAMKVHHLEDSDLVAAFRSGRLLDNVDLHRALWAQAVVETSVTKPSALSRIERRMAGLDKIDDEPA